MRPRRLCCSLTALVLTTGLAGCGGDASDAVTAKVKEFAHATATHDYVTICDDVLAPSLLADMTKGGIGCVQAMSIALGHVSRPRLVIGRVSVSGSTASVLTISQAKGEKTVLTSVRLVQTSAGWRIAALGSPVQ